MVRNVGKYGTFLEYSCLFTTGLFWLDEIVSGNGTFQEL